MSSLGSSQSIQTPPSLAMAAGASSTTDGAALNKSGKYISLITAFENGAEFDALSSGLQQQQMNQMNYKQSFLRYAIQHNWGYFDLPGWLATQLTEKRYFDDFVLHAIEALQLYPYAHIERVAFYTGYTPLSYYTHMLGELLKKEKSYDTLPNFTAVDILNLLGVGRNQYINTLRDVKSKIWWRVNRSFVKKHLPTQLLPSVTLDPYWRVRLTSGSFDEGRKLCETDAEIAVLKRLHSETFRPTSGAGLLMSTLTRSHSFNTSRQEAKREFLHACELPFNEVNVLHRKGAIVAAFDVEDHELVLVPPLQRFVMNRTSDDPQERLLYQILTTIDDRTPLETLAGMLHISPKQVCDTVGVYVRLGLAIRKAPPVPPGIRSGSVIIHDTWAWMLEEQNHGAGRGGEQPTAHVPGSASGSTTPRAAASATTARRHHTRTPSMLVAEMHSAVVAHRTASGTGADAKDAQAAASHPHRRAAILFDASLTGYLMMTNLSADPTFKQHAVTLFEAGKLTDEALGPFLKNLDEMKIDKELFAGDDANKFFDSVFCLRLMLHQLRTLELPGCAKAVDMLKIEAINELEATTRYTVMCRNYCAYFVVSPVAQPPLLDIMLEGLYGASISLVSSPWLLLYCYSQMGSGPVCALLRHGERVPVMPSVLQKGCDKDTLLRLAPLRGDAETHEFSSCTALLDLNDLLTQRPLFVTVIPSLPKHCSRCGPLSLPFVASAGSNDLDVLICERLGFNAAAAATERCQRVIEQVVAHHAHVVETLNGSSSLGYCTYELVLRTESEVGEGVPALVSITLVDIGLGIPLTDFRTCQAVLKPLQQLCTQERMDRHCENMRDLAANFGAFVDQFCHSAFQQREEAALQCASEDSRGTAQHIPAPTSTSLAVPFPSVALQFNGEELAPLTYD